MDEWLCYVHVMLKLCDIAFIPLLYTRLQLMRVAPREVRSAVFGN